MDAGLWRLYLRLQTEFAYGGSVGSSPNSERQVGSAADYVTRVLAQRSLNGSLLIGPGNENEVNVMRERLPGPLAVLTAHAPEATLLEGKWPDVTITVGDIHDMPYEPGKFQFVYASNVLEHCFAPYIALMECRRVLGSEGIGYFVLPSFEGVEGGRGPFHLHCLTKDVWTELLRKTGFTLVDTQIERGGEDPDGYYVHYKCAALTPPHPHGTLLNELITYKVLRGQA